MPDNTEKIAELEAMRDTGADSVSVDGLSTKLNQQLINKRLRELHATNTADGAKNRRPIASTIDLSGG